MGTTERALDKAFGSYAKRHGWMAVIFVFGLGGLWQVTKGDIKMAGDKADKNAKAIEILRKDYGEIRESQGITQEKLRGLTKAIDDKDRNDAEHRKNLQESLNILIRRRNQGGGIR